MAARLTDQLLADIVEISADAIICLDSRQRITLFNEGAEQIFGWTADEMLGQPLDALLPERARDAHRLHLEAFAKSPVNSRLMGERREISGLRKSGEEFPAEAAIAKVQTGDDVVFSVVLRDITEQVALHKRLRRAVAARDEIVGMVAHDLRNPLSAIKMLTRSVLADASSLPDSAAKHVELIRSAAEQMDGLIGDLLDVTRAEGGEMPVDPRAISVADLLEGALTTLRPLLDHAGLQLSVDAGPPSLRVSADAARIAQVLSNLVGNAIKFTPRGGRVSIVVDREDDVARVSVSDTGSGISRELLPHVFDRFWQSPQLNIRARGAGLGLPIARGIVQAHGGRIWVESEAGKGATFRFTLPLLQ